MGEPAVPDEGQHLRRETGRRVGARLGIRVQAWMQQLPGFAGHEPVGVQEIFLQRQAREAAIQIPGTVADHPVPQDEVLRAGGCADRVRLHEAEPAHGAHEGGGCEHRRQARLRAKLIKGGHSRHLVFDGNLRSIWNRPKLRHYLPLKVNPGNRASVPGLGQGYVKLRSVTRYVRHLVQHQRVNFMKVSNHQAKARW